MIWWLQPKFSEPNFNTWTHNPLRLGVIMMDFFDEQERGGDYLIDLLIPFNPGIRMQAADRDWMSTIPDAALISDLSIPGTQGSMTYTGKHRTYQLPQLPPEPSQILPLTSQLKAGIRAIEVKCYPMNGRFRLIWDREIEPGLIMPDSYLLPAWFSEDMLKPCALFLKENPTETILMRIEKVCWMNIPGAPCDYELQGVEWWETLQNHISEDSCYDELNGEFLHYEDYFWQTNDYSQFPMLGEVRGKIVILQDFDAPMQFGLPWNSFHVQESEATSTAKWNAVHECFLASGSGPSDSMYVNYTSSCWFNNHAEYAEDINMLTGEYLNDFHGECDMERLRTGIVMMDYPGPGLIHTLKLYNPQDLTSIDDPSSATLPTEFNLAQNHPNPFNPSTVIEFELPRRSHVAITIYNSTGQEVINLISNEYRAGYHEIIWDGLSSKGDLVSSGIYFYRIVAGDFISTKKMIMLK